MDREVGDASRVGGRPDAAELETVEGLALELGRGFGFGRRLGLGLGLSGVAGDGHRERQGADETHGAHVRNTSREGGEEGVTGPGNVTGSATIREHLGHPARLAPTVLFPDLATLHARSLLIRSRRPRVPRSAGRGGRYIRHDPPLRNGRGRRASDAPGASSGQGRGGAPVGPVEPTPRLSHDIRVRGNQRPHGCNLQNSTQDLPVSVRRFDRHRSCNRRRMVEAFRVSMVASGPGPPDLEHGLAIRDGLAARTSARLKAIPACLRRSPSSEPSWQV